MGSRYLILGASLAAGLLTAAANPVAAQENSIEAMELQIRNIRPSGQPVIPMFEGWYPREDGTYDLCFGAFNLNREEAIDIPLGPDNFIEPAQYDGIQPTHFREIGPQGRERYVCVFTVNVPADIGTEKVWWTLRNAGKTYRVPGHIGSRNYKVDDLSASFPQMLTAAEHVGEVIELPAASDRLSAPVVRFVEPAGPEGRGKGGVRASTASARVGTPLTIALDISAGGVVGEGGLVNGSVRWGTYQRPAGATVTFSPEESRLESGAESVQRTQVTFSEPGQYTLFAQVLQGSFSAQCCWTNAYVEVTVAP